MAKFPVDARIEDVIKALERLGFRLVREGNHKGRIPGSLRVDLISRSGSRAGTLIDPTRGAGS